MIDRAATGAAQRRRMVKCGIKVSQSLLAFTLVYGLFALALLAAQPKAGAVQTADAGGNFEVPADFGWFTVRLALAE